MPKRIPPLSETQIENARPSEKPIRLFDGAGLFLEIEPNGTKLWRYKYRFAGKQKMISCGIYPGVSLSDARLQRSEARRLLEEGFDPSAARKAERSRGELAEIAESKDGPSVRALIDGTFEIWKGRSVLRLTNEEAQFIKNLLNRLL